MRERAVAAFAVYRDVELIRGCHVLPGTHADFARFQWGMHVLPENACRFGIFQHAFFDHNRSAAGEEFFCRLENKFNRAFEFILDSI